MSTHVGDVPVVPETGVVYKWLARARPALISTFLWRCRARSELRYDDSEADEAERSARSCYERHLSPCSSVPRGQELTPCQVGWILGTRGRAQSPHDAGGEDHDQAPDHDGDPRSHFGRHLFVSAPPKRGAMPTNPKLRAEPSEDLGDGVQEGLSAGALDAERSHNARDTLGQGDKQATRRSPEHGGLTNPNQWASGRSKGLPTREAPLQSRAAQPWSWVGLSLKPRGGRPYGHMTNGLDRLPTRRVCPLPAPA
jgi:hypothetical protein